MTYNLLLKCYHYVYYSQFAEDLHYFPNKYHSATNSDGDCIEESDDVVGLAVQVIVQEVEI